MTIKKSYIIMKKIYKFYVLSSTDEPNNIRYVGVTLRESVKQRFYSHKYCAIHPEKRGLPVHKWMWSKYEQGLDIIVKEIDSCNEREWQEREKYWIAKYKEGGNLLNISNGGKGVIPKDSRMLSSIERSAKAHLKAITLLDKDGNVIEQCPSINYAVSKYNMSRTSIGNVLSGRSKTSKGFYIIETSKYNSPNFNIKEFFLSINNNTSTRKLIYRFNLDGTLIENGFKCDFKRKYHLDPNSILRAINNKTIFRESYWSTDVTIDINDFECEYKYLYKNKLYKNLKEIALELGIKECTISNARTHHKPINGDYVKNYQR